MRNMSPQEAFDAKVAELTEKHFAEKLTALCCGDRATLEAVDDALSFEFSKRATMHPLIVRAMNDTAQAGFTLERLIHKVLRDLAEVEAIKEVEQMVRDRKQQAEEARADLARM